MENIFIEYAKKDSNSFTLEYIAKYIEASLDGDPNQIINKLVSLEDDNLSTTDQAIVFFSDIKYKNFLENSLAKAIIVKNGLKIDANLKCKNILFVSNPYAAYAKLSNLFLDKSKYISGIDPTCIIHPTAKIDKTATLLPYSVVGENAIISKSAVIGSFCTIGANVSIGESTFLYDRVTLYKDVKIGDRCILHSGSVIGSDGYGFAPSEKGWIKIQQLGGVTVGNDVEIGANTTVDRGAINDTYIGDRTKIDNQVQIAHNVYIATDVMIAGCVGIAGSTRIGKGTLIGGAARIGGHISIVDGGVIITGCTTINKSITQIGTYSSTITGQIVSKWSRNLARLHSLDEIVRSIKKMFLKLSA